MFDPTSLFSPDAFTTRPGLLTRMPGAVGPVIHIHARSAGWLPQLSARTPHRPESLRARLLRQSHALHAEFDLNQPASDHVQDDYHALMNRLHGLRGLPG